MLTDVSEELTASTHHPNDGGSKLLWNVSQYLPDYTVQHPRRQPSSYLSLRGHQISQSWHIDKCEKLLGVYVLENVPKVIKVTEWWWNTKWILVQYILLFVNQKLYRLLSKCTITGCVKIDINSNLFIVYTYWNYFQCFWNVILWWNMIKLFCNKNLHISVCSEWNCPWVS
jgi:hypothetical protein